MSLLLEASKMGVLDEIKAIGEKMRDDMARNLADDETMDEVKTAYWRGQRRGVGLLISRLEGVVEKSKKTVDT
jgi:hypothetical protein